jgi:hypothetical protein
MAWKLTVINVIINAPAPEYKCQRFIGNKNERIQLAPDQVAQGNFENVFYHDE